MMKDMPFAPYKDEVAYDRYIEHILYRFSELQTQAMERPIEKHEYEDELSYLLEQRCDKIPLFAKRFIDAFSIPEQHQRFEAMDQALRGLYKQFQRL